MCAFTAHSQQSRYKFKVIKYKTVYNDKFGEFSWATESRDTSFLVVIETDNKKIVFYGNDYHSFDITQTADNYEDEDPGWKWIKWIACLDNNSVRCNIRIQLLINNSTDKFKGGFLYVDYKNRNYVYNIQLAE